MRKNRFPEQLDPPLEYARMHIEVIGWTNEAEDEDERDRLGELASYYLSCAIESGNREHDGLRAALPDGVRQALDSNTLEPERYLTRAEAEFVRVCFAVPAVAMLDTLAFAEMQDLADMYEGWAQDARVGRVNVPRLLGMADSLRTVAELAGPAWKPAPEEPPSLCALLARNMRKVGSAPGAR